jgi:hypothetical protein
MKRFIIDVKHILKPNLTRKGYAPFSPKAKRPRGATTQALTNCKLTMR